MLATDGTNSFVIFLYADQLLQWTLHKATVGYDTKNGTNFYNVPESDTLLIINITHTSNVGIPGIWMFQTGQGMCIHCGGVVKTIIYFTPHAERNSRGHAYLYNKIYISNNVYCIYIKRLHYKGAYHFYKDKFLHMTA